MWCLSQGGFSTAVWVVQSRTVGDSLCFIERSIQDIKQTNISWKPIFCQIAIALLEPLRSRFFAKIWNYYEVLLTGNIICSYPCFHNTRWHSSEFVNEYGSSIFLAYWKLFVSINAEVFPEVVEKFILKGREQEGRETDWIYSIMLANAIGLLAGI